MKLMNVKENLIYFRRGLELRFLAYLYRNSSDPF